MRIKLSDYILEQSISDTSVSDIALEQTKAEIEVSMAICEAYIKQMDMSVVMESSEETNDDEKYVHTKKTFVQHLLNFIRGIGNFVQKLIIRFKNSISRNKLRKILENLQKMSDEEKASFVGYLPFKTWEDYDECINVISDSLSVFGFKIHNYSGDFTRRPITEEILNYIRTDIDSSGGKSSHFKQTISNFKNELKSLVKLDADTTYKYDYEDYYDFILKLLTSNIYSIKFNQFKTDIADANINFSEKKCKEVFKDYRYIQSLVTTKLNMFVTEMMKSINHSDKLAAEGKAVSNKNSEKHDEYKNSIAERVNSVRNELEKSVNNLLEKLKHLKDEYVRVKQVHDLIPDSELTLFGRKLKDAYHYTTSNPDRFNKEIDDIENDIYNLRPTTFTAFIPKNSMTGRKDIPGYIRDAEDELESISKKIKREIARTDEGMDVCEREQYNYLDYIFGNTGDLKDEDVKKKISELLSDFAKKKAEMDKKKAEMKAEMDKKKAEERMKAEQELVSKLKKKRDDLARKMAEFVKIFNIILDKTKDFTNDTKNELINGDFYNYSIECQHMGQILPSSGQSKDIKARAFDGKLCKDIIYCDRAIEDGILHHSEISNETEKEYNEVMDKLDKMIKASKSCMNKLDNEYDNVIETDRAHKTRLRKNNYDNLRRRIKEIAGDISKKIEERVGECEEIIRIHKDFNSQLDRHQEKLIKQVFDCRDEFNRIQKSISDEYLSNDDNVDALWPKLIDINDTINNSEKMRLTPEISVALYKKLTKEHYEKLISLKDGVTDERIKRYIDDAIEDYDLFVKTTKELDLSYIKLQATSFNEECDSVFIKLHK